MGICHISAKEHNVSKHLCNHGDNRQCHLQSSNRPYASSANALNTMSSLSRTPINNVYTGIFDNLLQQFSLSKNLSWHYANGKQENHAVAKMTARCAQYVSALKIVGLCKRKISRGLRKNLHITILGLSLFGGTVKLFSKYSIQCDHGT